MIDFFEKQPAHKSVSVPSAVLSLLDASPYVWNKTSTGSDFAWEDTELASALFCSRAEDVSISENGFVQRICGDGKSIRDKAVASLSWNGCKFKIDYQIRTFDGRNIWVEERGQRVEGDGRRASKIIGIVSNIQSRKIREEQAGYHASFDGLTGLWNKTRMAEGLAQLLAFAQRYDRQAAYLCIKISNLNDINEADGYEAGDRLLCAVAKRLTSCVRSPDICARVSDVSFGIGLSDCDQDQMQMIAQRIVNTLSSMPYASPYGDLYAQFSVGGSACSLKSVSASDAMEQGYTAVAHSVLNQGEFVAYGADLPDLKPRQNIADITRDGIIAALNDRRITLAYQPIVHAKGRAVHHYECLLRLRREDGEVVSAAEFIMAAERLECVHLLDRRALEIASRILQNDSHIKLALNVSAAMVKNKETSGAYLTALRALGKDCKRVIVELTETVALEDPTMASRFSVKVKNLGCQFAIDDFGAGHTTFSNLLAIEADELKIDGSFIQDLSLTPHKQVFVRMMVDLAKTFSVKTVAEMVGSREDAELLTRLGVDYLQGYMFGVPGPAPLAAK